MPAADDFARYEALDWISRAVWVFDVERRRVHWANAPALALWQADSLDTLRNRDLGVDMSPSVARRLAQFQHDLQAGRARVTEQWTLYPGGVPRTLHIAFSGHRLADGRAALLCEALDDAVSSPDSLRSVDALMHTPVMITLYDWHARVLYRNPAARDAQPDGTLQGHRFVHDDDLRALLRAQGEVIRHNLRYVGLSLVPLVVTAIPLTLAIAQMQAWYGYDGLAVGQPTAVTATVADGAASLPRLESSAVEVVGPARYFPTRHEVVWRVVPRQPGPSLLRIVPADGAAIEKTLHVGPATARRSPSRERANLVQQLLYPSESPIDDGLPVHAVTVPYPERSLDVAGYHVHWLVAYLALSVVWVLVLRGPMGVVI
jgi:hypothetical protein